jgi:hypothetical protein
MTGENRSNEGEILGGLDVIAARFFKSFKKPHQEVCNG